LPTKPTDIHPGLRQALIDRYRIERELGSGGMAVVYLAEDSKHDRRVALKVLRPDLGAALANDRFLAEIRVTARLDHPHILALYDSGEAAGYLYYVMPYVADGSLRQRLNRELRIPPPEALRITQQVAAALDYAHGEGVIHRDIKPENILLSKGHSVVADFGVAKALTTAGGQRLTRTGFPVGTLGYMSPEQAAGRPQLDERTDIHSLACVSYEMIIGETPEMWVSDEAGRLERFLDASPRHRERLDSLPGRVEATLVQAMRLHPEDRHRSAGDFAAELAESFAGQRVYSDGEAREIVQRAAELEARPTEENAVSLGGIQQIAAEAGIAPQHVREAAAALNRPKAEIARGGFFGSTGRVDLEMVVDGEVAERDYGAILEEIRHTIGQAGRVNETFDDSFSWEFKPGFGEWTRRVQITLSPSGGRTRIRIAEHAGAEDELKLLSVAGGMVLVGGAIAISANIGGEVVLGVGFLAGGAAWIAQYAGFRFWYQRFIRKRSRVLAGLAQRIGNLFSGPDRLALLEDDVDNRSKRHR
jgi:hypothetical protein